MALEMNSKSVEYKGNKVIIKSMPKDGENLSVFIRPGDEVVFDIDGVNSEALDYALVGGDIVVEFPGKGALTFPSMGLMSFSSNPPQFSFGGKLFSVENLLSRIEEINELPITSVDASFKVRVSDTDEDRGLMHDKPDKAPAAPIIIVPQSQVLPDNYDKREDFTQTQQEVQKSYDTRSEVVVKNTVPPTYTKPYSTKPNDFDDYKPKVEMIPKPDVEMIPKPDVEMIPKPDVEMIPKPDVDMIPDNGFTNDNDFTDYFPENNNTGMGDGYGNGDGNGDGEGEGIPTFGFNLTAHQVRFSEILNADNTAEILGGGGSVLGYKNASITNQFEPETIDISNRTEDMVIRTENSDYFSNAPSTTIGVNALTFQDLITGQSITVDGLTLTASGAISAADVAIGFANLAASTKAINVTAMEHGNWSGELSAGWKSSTAAGDKVTFTSTAGNSDINVFSTSSAGSVVAVASNQGVATTTTETHALTFQDLAANQSVTVDGLTLTASGAISAAEVAAGFANLAASKVAADMTAIANGTWSGNLSAGWSSAAAAAGAVVTFTSTTPTAPVTDIVVTSAGLTVAPPTITIANSTSQSEVYLSRVLRFELNMTEGFYLNDFTIDGLPSGVKILDKDANELTGSTVSKDDMIFKNLAGEEIFYNVTPDFLTSVKSVEFTIKYNTAITNPFNLKITANYKVDDTYAENVTEPEQSHTNEYTFALKDIGSVDDYTYNQSEFAGGLADGFILSKEPNYNIIKDGSGNNVIYGGTVKDVVTDAAGDDTYYLSAGDDTLYGGSGTNRIYGDSDNGSAEAKEYEGEDTISYEKVNSFGVSEIELLSKEGVINSDENQKLSGTYDEDLDPLTPNSTIVDMLASYKGVYVDLDGMVVQGLDIDGDGTDDTINAISKFANRDGRFTYDDNGYAIGTSIGKTITFTSSTQNAQVTDLVVSGNVAVTAVADPTALDIVTIQGVNATTTEKSDITFQDLIAGQSVTIDGLKLTATGNITAAAVAAGFASLAPSATGNVIANGTWSGALSAGWSSGGATTATVAFTSATANTSVTDIATASAGVTGVDGADAIEVSTKQGSSDIDTRGSEKTTLIFKDLTAGQFVSVGGLTLTANGAISASAVAAGFSELSSGATAGNTVTNGAWSGTLGAFSSSAQESGLESIQATGYDIYENIENITGSIYNDTIYGNAAKDNILKGLGGSDTIDGRGGDNKLYGGDGGDTLISGTGKDYIDGGGDTDTVSYVNMSAAMGGVTIRFDRPNTEEYDYAYLSNDVTKTIKDKILNVENITGSGYADTIYGNANTNFIQAGAGNDKIYAGGGYDFIDGGVGSDWITYLPADYTGSLNKTFMETFQGITVDLNSSDFVMVKETSSNNLIDLIKSIEKISATDGIDKIYGSDSASEELWGWGGNDILWGRNGADIIHGGTGDDTIRPGRGVDTSYGNMDATNLVGGGTDYLELYDDGLKDRTFQAIRLSETGVVQYRLASATVPNPNPWIDGYNSIDGVELAYGFSGIGLSNNTADEIYGNELANIINAYSGDDYIDGKGGNDTIRGGDGADTIYGGDGNDIIYGDQGNDTIDAGTGDDTVYGYGMYTTGVQNKDIIDGGVGFDTINYSGTSTAFTLNMSAIAPDADATVQFGVGAGIYDDKIKNFESVVGSTGADTITANNSGMTLDGWSGVDKLYGGSGDDTIIARNQATEILNGESGVDLAHPDKDTLKLAQTVDFRNLTVSNFETLDFGTNNNYYAQFNLSQWSSNSFSKIVGGSNNRLFIYAANNTTVDTFDFKSIDFSGFSGAIYTYGYAGNDTIDLTNVTSIDSIKLYLDAGNDTDTLKIGTVTTNNLTIKLTENNFNSFEKFEIATGSTLEVNAQNNNNLNFGNNVTKDFTAMSGIVNMTGGDGINSFSFNSSNFTNMIGKINMDGKAGNDAFALTSANFTGITGELNMDGGDGNDTFTLNSANFTNMTGKINMDSGAGNDTFNLTSSTVTSMTGEINMKGGVGDDTFNTNYESLLSGKLKIDGGSEIDTVKINATTATNLSFDSTSSTMFDNIEKLDLTSINQARTISMNASSMEKWLGGDDLILDLSNATQANNVNITNATSIINDANGLSVAKLSMAGNYHIVADDTTSFALHVI